MRKFRRKHSKAEIAGLLAQASELSAEGHLQSEIADRLGISVMTLHRWRKMSEESLSAEGDGPALAPAQDSHVNSFAEEVNRRARADDPDIAALRVENSRLRRLVTDLMLEKMQYLEQNSLVRSRKA